MIVLGMPNTNKSDLVKLYTTNPAEKGLALVSGPHENKDYKDVYIFQSLSDNKAYTRIGIVKRETESAIMKVVSGNPLKINKDLGLSVDGQKVFPIDPTRLAQDISSHLQKNYPLYRELDISTIKSLSTQLHYIHENFSDIEYIGKLQQELQGKGWSSVFEHRIGHIPPMHFSRNTPIEEDRDFIDKLDKLIGPTCTELIDFYEEMEKSSLLINGQQVEAVDVSSDNKTIQEFMQHFYSTDITSIIFALQTLEKSLDNEGYGMTMPRQFKKTTRTIKIYKHI